jgi:glycosyltransferase involved in cell wall biosynthesis
MKVPVSVLIPIKNEAHNLPRCLEAVAWAAEIFVVDSHSTDGSQAVVEEFAIKAESGKRKAESRNLKPEGSGWNEESGKLKAEREELKVENGKLKPEEGVGTKVKLVQFDFNGTWPKKKNWSLENLPFSYEWVFILDADEVMPPEAEAEFRQIVTANEKWTTENGKQKAEIGNDVDGYWINRRFMFVGKWLKHAYYPNWNLRLFRHKLGRYEKLTDVATASGDNEVHEHVVIKGGRTGRLKCEMDHYAFPSVDVFIEKHNRYANWEARVAMDTYLKSSSGGLQMSSVGIRRKLKLLSQKLPFRPTLRFLYVYVWQCGFLDGTEGYHFARLHAVYEYLCVVKTFELKRQLVAQKPQG